MDNLRIPIKQAPLFGAHNLPFRPARPCASVFVFAKERNHHLGVWEADMGHAYNRISGPMCWGVFPRKIPKLLLFSQVLKDKRSSFDVLWLHRIPMDDIKRLLFYVLNQSQTAENPRCFLDFQFQLMVKWLIGLVVWDSRGMQPFLVFKF